MAHSVELSIYETSWYDIALHQNFMILMFKHLRQMYYRLAHGI